MELGSLIVFGAALLAAAAMPGPNMVALVARVLARGPRGAAAFTVGLGLGDLVWLACAVGGLAMLAQSFHWLFLAVKWAGICYLLWMAWRMWRAPEPGLRAQAPVADGQIPASEHPVRLMFAGLALTLGNPKVMMFYLALLPAIIDLRAVDLTAFAELCAVVALVLTLVFSSYIALASLARRFLAAPSRVRTLNRASALTMCGAAGWVATR